MRLCYNTLKNKYEPCDNQTIGGGGRGKAPLTKFCGADCALSDIEITAMFNFLLNLKTMEINIGPPPFTTPTINDIIIGWNFLYAPDLSFVGNELYWQGSPTGWQIANVTNQGQQWGIGAFMYQIEFEAAPGCLNFVSRAAGQVAADGPDAILRPVDSSIGFGPFGSVTNDTPLRGCLPSDVKCEGTPPTLSLTSPIVIDGTIPTGSSTIDLGGPLYEDGDSCCVFRGLTTDQALIEATLSANKQYITFHNYGTDFTGTISIGLWTTCGYQPDFIEIEFPTCDYDFNFVNDHYVFSIPDTTGVFILRATDAYELVDISGCCAGEVVGSVDHPDIDVTFLAGNYYFTYTGSDYGSVFAGSLSFQTSCGDIFTAPLTIIFLDTACAGAINDDVTDLNTAFNSGNPFTVPLSGSTVIDVTSNIFSFTDPCCGTEAAILNVSAGMYNTPGLTISPILNDGTTDITLTSDGTPVVGVQSVQLNVVSACGNFLVDLDYEIV